MKTRLYKTLPGLMKACGARSFSLYEFLEKRFYSNGKSFKVTDELHTKLLNMFASALWERGAEKKAYKLERVGICGILRRVCIDMYRSNKTKKLEFRPHYCAGQDYPSEIRFIQRMVNNS